MTETLSRNSDARAAINSLLTGGTLVENGSVVSNNAENAAEVGGGDRGIGAASGNSTDKTLAQLHEVLLLMLKDFSAICARENLSWIIAYGSAIGALRHKGFIPWDDDIDIAMPRCDLEKLGSIVEKDPVISKRYCLVNSQIDPNYPMATWRIMLRDTIFHDANLSTMNFDSGIFLDLFPLDNLADDEHAFKRQIWRAWLYNKLAIAKLTRNPYVANGGVRAVVLKTGAHAARMVLNLPGLRAIKLNEHAFFWLTRYQNCDTRRIGYPCDTNRFWGVFERDDVFPTRMAAFEDMEVPIANRTEKLLAVLYGDFMTPISEDKRAEHYPEVLDIGPWENARPLDL